MNKPTSSLNKIALASLLAITGVWTTAANAQTATDTLAVDATVSASCTIGTTTVAFGDYDPVNTNSTTDLDNTGEVSVTCTSGSSATITLGAGANAGGSSTDAAPERRLTDATDFLTYSLFSDSERTTEWGNTELTGVASSGTGNAVAHTVYGRIDQGQSTVGAGTYSDTVTATVTF